MTEWQAVWVLGVQTSIAHQLYQQRCCTAISSLIGCRCDKTQGYMALLGFINRSEPVLCERLCNSNERLTCRQPHQGCYRMKSRAADVYLHTAKKNCWPICEWIYQPAHRPGCYCEQERSDNLTAEIKCFISFLSESRLDLPPTNISGC